MMKTILTNEKYGKYNINNVKYGGNAIIEN